MTREKVVSKPVFKPNLVVDAGVLIKRHLVTACIGHTMQVAAVPETCRLLAMPWCQ